MVIAINARFLNKPVQDEISIFLLNTWLQIAAAQTDHRFLLISDRPFPLSAPLPDNVEPLIAGPVCKNCFLDRWWQRFTLPGLLKKEKASLYFSTDGMACMHTTIPQYLLLSGTGYLQQPELHTANTRRYARQLLPQFLKKTKKVITLSDSEKEILQAQYHLDPSRVTAIKPFINHSFTRLDYARKKQVKETYTDGCEYFFYSGSFAAGNNLLNLLKAFSKFKKRQQSNWKLVIAVDDHNTTFLHQLGSYKHKDDVVLIQDAPPEVLPGLTAAAYAFVLPVKYDGTGIRVLQAMQCGVPVITGNHSTLRALAPEAALYVNPESIDDIAQQLMLLYKDEHFCKKLTEKAAVFAGSYHNPGAAGELWQTVAQ